jgi:hypothetical protein
VLAIGANSSFFVWCKNRQSFGGTKVSSLFCPEESNREVAASCAGLLKILVFIACDKAPLPDCGRL